MFGRTTVASNNDNSIRTTNTHKERSPKANPVFRVWVWVYIISFNLHDTCFEKKKKKDRAIERKLVQVQHRNRS